MILRDILKQLLNRITTETLKRKSMTSFTKKNEQGRRPYRGCFNKNYTVESYPNKRKYNLHKFLSFEETLQMSHLPESHTNQNDEL